MSSLRLALPLICGPLLLGNLVACTDYAAELDGTSFDEDSAAMADALGLRIDATATYGLVSDSSLVQTFLIDSPSTGLRLELDAPIRLTGTVTGYDASPTTNFVAVPGSTVRVEGVLEAWVADTGMQRSAQFGDDGRFRVELVPDLDYVVAWVPTSPAELPFLVSKDTDLSENTDISVFLDYGQPVYGQVTGETGPLRDVPVKAMDSATGVVGPTVTTGADGRYMLRLYPGEYSLIIGEGLQTGLPVARLPLQVTEDGGVEQDMAYGYSGTNNLVDGEVRDTNGEPVANVVVRLTSQLLDGTPYGSLVTEADTSSNGRFSVRVQPGTYKVEYLPPANSTLNPVELPEEVVFGEGRSVLEDTTLTRRPTVEATVIGADGLPEVDALVRARELSFDGYVFETYTDSEGKFSMEVTDADLTWLVIPKSGSVSALQSLDMSAESLNDSGEIILTSGVELAGQVVFEGAAAPFTSLELRSLNGDLYTRLITDTEGRFSFRLAEIP